MEVVRAAIAQAPEAERTTPPQRNDHAKLTLETFLAELKWKNAADLIDAFAQNAQFVDVFGGRWDREGISKSFETLFAPYAKKNATPSVDEILADEADLFVASVIWKNAVVASMERVWIHRMSVVLIRDREAWRILLIQATALQPLQA